MKAILALAAACALAGCNPRESSVAGTLGPRVLTEAGSMAVEDYVAGVVDCEIAHHTSAPAALDAQAIAARTFLLAHLERRGSRAVVPIGPHFQCWRKPVHQRSRAAAKRTAGQVIRWRGRTINANYAAGASPLLADCTPALPLVYGYGHSSWDDMRNAYRSGERFSRVAWTQLFVTDNRGRRGDRVRATLQAEKSPPNRGSLGQHGAICLAEKVGLRADEIVRAFYGEDVQVVAVSAMLGF